MPAPLVLAKLPKPVLFALCGALGGLLGALALGEPVWYLLRPARPATPPTPPPVPQLAVSAAAEASLYAGGSNTVGVQVARAHFAGPVTVTFDPPPGLSVTPLVIPADQTAGVVTLTAAPDVKPGPFALRAIARASADGTALAATAEKWVHVTVVAPPPVPPRLAVSVSPKIQVFQRGKNTVAVQVARAGFAGDVEVTLADLPAGVRAAPVTVPADKTEASVELFADVNAPAGTAEIRADARARSDGDPLEASAQARVEVIAPPRVPVDIVFALDISGSMQWAINGTSKGIQAFVDQLADAQFDVRVGLVGFQDTTLGQPLKLIKIDGEKLTANFAKFRAEVGKLRAGGGGAEGESSLDGVAEAAEFPFRTQVTRVVVLVTDEGPKRPDGRMKSIEETAELLKEKKVNQIHVVTLPELKKPFEPLWEGAKGQYFNLRALNEGAESFSKLLPDVSKAIVDLVADRPTNKPELPPVAPPPRLPDAVAATRAVLPPTPQADAPKLAEVKSLQSNEVTAAGTEWRQVLRSGLWTGLIAALVCLALLMGQTSYLRGGRPPTGAILIGLGGGLLAGFVGGVAGQGLFLLAKTDSAALGALLRVLAWALLGGLAGAGLAFFVPNLGVAPGALGGTLGGAAGALGYLATAAVAGDTAGRLAGGLALGAAIGLMVALAERAFRRAWLEVRYGEREFITVNLGPEPVKVGGDAKACAVWARGAAAVALRFFVRDGKVVCDDPVNRSEGAVRDGDRRTVGGVTVVVRTGDGRAPLPVARSAAKKPARDDDYDPLPLPVPPVPAKPQAAAVAPATAAKPKIAAAPKAGEGCPGCGRKIPGSPGARYCMVCDTTF